jgi:hypothetical protein
MNMQEKVASAIKEASVGKVLAGGAALAGGAYAAKQYGKSKYDLGKSDIIKNIRGAANKASDEVKKNVSRWKSGKGDGHIGDAVGRVLRGQDKRHGGGWKHSPNTR